MNPIAWETYLKFGSVERSARHLNGEDGFTLCGLKLPDLDRVDVLYHGEQVPDHVPDCALCAGLSGMQVLMDRRGRLA